MPEISLRDLWPKEINVDVLSPLMILNEQAEVLAKRTQGVIQSEVPADESEKMTKLYFDLVAPAANNFRQRVLTVRQKKGEAYPAVVSAQGLAAYPGEIRQPNFAYWSMSPEERGLSYIAINPDEFIELIAFIFGSTDVRTTVISLLAKTNEAKVPLRRVRKETLLNEPESGTSLVSEYDETQIELHKDEKLENPPIHG